MFTVTTLHLRRPPIIIRDQPRLRRAVLSSVALHQLVPFPLGFEDEISYVAYGAMAADTFRHEMRGSLCALLRIGNRNGESDALHDRNVGNVVADEGDFARLELCANEHVFEGLDFVMAPLPNKLLRHAQLPGALLHEAGAA